MSSCSASKCDLKRAVLEQAAHADCRGWTLNLCYLTTVLLSGVMDSDKALGKRWQFPLCSGKWAVKLTCGLINRILSSVQDRYRCWKWKVGKSRVKIRHGRPSLSSWVLVVQYCCRHGQERWRLPRLARPSQARVFPSIIKAWPKAIPKAL